MKLTKKLLVSVVLSIGLGSCAPAYSAPSTTYTELVNQVSPIVWETITNKRRYACFDLGYIVPSNAQGREGLERVAGGYMNVFSYKWNSLNPDQKLLVLSLESALHSTLPDKDYCKGFLNGIHDRGIGEYLMLSPHHYGAEE